MKPLLRSLQSWKFWVVNGIAVVSLVLVIANILLAQGNTRVQAQTNSRQQFINQSIGLSRLNNQIIRSLASLSAQTDDQQIKNLLEVHGVTFTVNTPPKPTNKSPEDKSDDAGPN